MQPRSFGVRPANAVLQSSRNVSFAWFSPENRQCFDRVFNHQRVTEPVLQMFNKIDRIFCRLPRSEGFLDFVLRKNLVVLASPSKSLG